MVRHRGTLQTLTGDDLMTPGPIIGPFGPMVPVAATGGVMSGGDFAVGQVGFSVVSPSGAGLAVATLGFVVRVAETVTTFPDIIDLIVDGGVIPPVPLPTNSVLLETGFSTGGFSEYKCKGWLGFSDTTGLSGVDFSDEFGNSPALCDFIGPAVFSYADIDNEFFHPEDPTFMLIPGPTALRYQGEFIASTSLGGGPTAIFKPGLSQTGEPATPGEDPTVAIMVDGEHYLADGFEVTPPDAPGSTCPEIHYKATGTPFSIEGNALPAMYLTDPCGAGEVNMTPIRLVRYVRTSTISSELVIPSQAAVVVDFDPGAPSWETDFNINLDMDSSLIVIHDWDHLAGNINIGPGALVTIGASTTHQNIGTYNVEGNLVVTSGTTIENLGDINVCAGQVLVQPSGDLNGNPPLDTASCATNLDNIVAVPLPTWSIILLTIVIVSGTYRVYRNIS